MDETKTKVTLVLCVLSMFDVNAQNTINENHDILLNEDYGVALKWRVDGDSIFFEMSAETQGYVAIGFSPNGGMPGSDIVAGWVKSGEAFLSDRHATTYSKPNADLSDDYELLYGYEEGGKTTIGFKRKLETCDSNDYTITSDTARIIWAVNENDPANLDDLIYHGTSRGVRSVLLLDAARKLRELPADAGFFDINMPNVTVPDDKDTTYWCSSFEAPQFEQPVHVIRFDALVQKGHEAVVHHMLLYGCRGNLSTVVGWSSVCDREAMPPDIAECATIIFAWAIGGGSFEFPDHVGLPLGGENDPTFFYIEMHYDNPAFSSDFHDNSGLRVHYTPTLRQYVADIWMVGESVSMLHMIPPNESEFKTHGFCFGECTSVGMSDDVHVFGAFLHGHIAARQISLQQYRDGKLIDETRDDHYDFNLQETRVLTHENTFKPGDAYVVSCTFNTVGRENVTVGGDGTSQEMCLVFVYYYPKQAEIGYCLSTPSIGSYFEIFEIPYDENFDYGDFEEYTYQYVTTQVEPEKMRNGLREIANSGKRYNYCFDDDFGYINSGSFELEFPEWFNADQRIASPDLCTVDTIEEPTGDGNTLRAGYCSVIMMIVICIMFL